MYICKYRYNIYIYVTYLEYAYKMLLDTISNEWLLNDIIVEGVFHIVNLNKLILNSSFKHIFHIFIMVNIKLIWSLILFKDYIEEVLV